MIKFLISCAILTLTCLSSANAANLEKDWNYITVCTNVNTKEIVLKEKSKEEVGRNIDEYIFVHDLNTGNRVYYFPLGAILVCMATDKETYEKRN